jgi:UPF0042 nucleotide-binding protein
MDDTWPIRLVIVTGLSGAGKTQAIRCLEDMGFFCVDNLPPKLISKIAELCQQSGERVRRLALVIDVRGGLFFDDLSEELESFRQQGINYEILFLEASDEVLVRRYKESRRQHPLGEEVSVLEAIRAERERLRELRGMASVILDTTGMTARDLKENLTQLFGKPDRSGMVITLLSFGYKYGIPLDADMVMDVRFLPNPNYVEELKYLTGLDPAVAAYIFKDPATRSFLRRYYNLLHFLLPYYAREGKSNLVLAIGCTGGQHRSVAVAEYLSHLLRRGYHVNLHHRDISRQGARLA